MSGQKKVPRAPTAEEARRRGSLGGKKSAEARKKRKALRELLEVALMMPADCGGTRIDSIVSALIGKAETGDTKAFEVIRDTLGEKPTEAYNIGISKPIQAMDLGSMSDEELAALADREA
jgi:hypothetical protein